MSDATSEPEKTPADFFAGSRRACGWPRRTRQGPVRLLTPEEFSSWIIYEDRKLLVVAKSGDAICHPSKAGPWSSLVGAAREYTGLETMHLIFRLDRETSGIVIFAKDAVSASALQTAMMDRQVKKEYIAILTGEMREAVTVDQPLGDDLASPVFVKSAVVPDGKASVSHFTPLGAAGGFTLARVVTESGRKHQIRAHAQWLKFPIVGDKIYGPDDRLYLEFIDTGWTDALAAKLLLPRQALHCSVIDLRPTGWDHVFRAPPPPDLQDFCAQVGLSMSL